MTTRAFIAGCSGLALTPIEAAFYREAMPWGFILFRRNIDNPAQVTALCAALRESVGWDAPILIDQEGGRVQRWVRRTGRNTPPRRPTAALHANDPLVRREITRLGARLIAHDLRAVGINVDCMPVLDVPDRWRPRRHRRSGLWPDARSGGDPGPRRRRGTARRRCTAGDQAHAGPRPRRRRQPPGAACRGGVARGTGAARFAPFRMLSDMPMAMTAHVVYTALDPHSPATTSRIVMDEIVRGHLAYDGLVDDRRPIHEGALGHVP